jgi:hypothetical protein
VEKPNNKATRREDPSYVWWFINPLTILITPSSTLLNYFIQAIWVNLAIIPGPNLEVWGIILLIFIGLVYGGK